MNGHSGEVRMCSPAFTGRIEPQCPTHGDLVPRGIDLSVATPKSQAKEPIQFDIILVCRKRNTMAHIVPPTESDALTSARKKLLRLYADGFTLSLNDRRLVLLGQLLTLLRAPDDFESIARHINDDIHALASSEPVRRH